MLLLYEPWSMSILMLLALLMTNKTVNHCTAHKDLHMQTWMLRVLNLS